MSITKLINYILLITVLFCSTKSFSRDVDDFPDSFIKTMVEKDSKSLRENMEQSVEFSDKDILLIFKQYSGFFKNNEIIFKIFSIDLKDDSYSNNRATIVFSNLKQIENITWADVGVNWNKNYLALDIICVNGIWIIDNTPFYIFRHVPWAEDYG